MRSVAGSDGDVKYFLTFDSDFFLSLISPPCVGHILSLKDRCGGLDDLKPSSGTKGVLKY